MLEKNNFNKKFIYIYYVTLNITVNGNVANMPECELLQSAKIFWDASDGHFNDPQ